MLEALLLMHADVKDVFVQLGRECPRQEQPCRRSKMPRNAFSPLPESTSIIVTPSGFAITHRERLTEAMAPVQPPEDSKPKSRPKNFVAKASRWFREAVEGGKHSERPAPDANNQKPNGKSYFTGSVTKSSYKITKTRTVSSDHKHIISHNEPLPKVPQEVADEYQSSVGGGFSTAFDNIKVGKPLQTQPHSGDFSGAEPANEGAFTQKHLNEKVPKWSELAREALLNDQPLPDYYSNHFDTYLRKPEDVPELPKSKSESDLARKLELHAQNRRASRQTTPTCVDDDKDAEASPATQESKEADLDESDPNNVFEPPFEPGIVTKLLPINESHQAEPHRPLDLYHTHLRARSLDDNIRIGRRPSHRRTHSYAVDDEVYEPPGERPSIASKPYDAMRANEVRKLLEQDVAGLAIYEKEVENWSADDLPNLRVQLKFQFVASGLELSDSDVKACVSLVEHTSGKDYKSSSLGWKPKKKEAEIKDKDMMHLLIRTHDLSARLLGFMSFKFDVDDPPKQDREVVYLFEIHLLEMLRGRGLGGKLLNFLEAVARRCGVSKTMLTVFVANEAARGMYEKAGYVKDDCSPGDRVVRNRVKKADYLIMSKEL